MTSEDLRKKREYLGLNQGQAAALLGVSVKSWRRWEADPSMGYSRSVPPSVAVVMGWFVDEGFRPKAWPTSEQVVD